ncbi:MAG TPA: hypothetical protein VJN92_02000 [Candidatus Acidoferrum sp.]|nr:hypothetical protein [Candidatus Acidoferrum sp.]
MLSDFPVHLFGRTINITGQEQFLAVLFVVVAVATWGVLQIRHRRAVVLHRSAVTDQMVYELSRIADTLDRLATRPTEQTFHQSIPTVAAGTFKEDEPRTMPFSMFGRER